MAKKIEIPDSLENLPQTVIKQMLILATSGFGLVAALAWNEVIKEIVNQYIKPYFSKSSSLISLIIYASIVTALAVVVTLQLTHLSAQLETKNKTDKT